jgi:hypothetical protein
MADLVVWSSSLRWGFIHCAAQQSEGFVRSPGGNIHEVTVNYVEELIRRIELCLER